MIDQVGKNRWTSIFDESVSDHSVSDQVYFQTGCQKQKSQILLSHNNIWTINLILFSWSTSVRATDVAHAIA